jgi:hypothetical protein
LLSGRPTATKLRPRRRAVLRWLRPPATMIAAPGAVPAGYRRCRRQIPSIAAGMAQGIISLLGSPNEPHDRLR